MKRGGGAEKEQNSATDHSALLRHNARALANPVISHLYYNEVQRVFISRFEQRTLVVNTLYEIVKDIR
jgi:hypothetical protein